MDVMQYIWIAAIVLLAILEGATAQLVCIWFVIGGDRGVGHQYFYRCDLDSADRVCGGFYLVPSDHQAAGKKSDVLSKGGYQRGQNRRTKGHCNRGR